MESDCAFGARGAVPNQVVGAVKIANNAVSSTRVENQMIADAVQPRGG